MGVLKCSRQDSILKRNVFFTKWNSETAFKSGS